jgi:multidrug efflux pump
MLSRIFIDRPIFAWVIAIIVMLFGAGAIYTLPIEQYPDVAPPEVNISARYPGASAETLSNSVTQVIEQQLTGLDGLLYFRSSSSSRGQVTISATFEKGTDPDIAQVQVQNKVQQAVPRLPQQVQQQGLTVTKSNPDFMLIVGVYDTTDSRTNQDVADYLVSNLQDPIGRIRGVGDTRVFGSQYAMRIWLNPEKLVSYSLIPDDIIAAIQAQNTQVAAGEIGGQPMPRKQMLDATVTAQSRLSTPEQFRNIIVKTRKDGSTVRLSDTARVELGAESYSVLARANGHPAAGMAVFLAPGADALATAQRVKDAIVARASSFPAGLSYGFPFDSTTFIKKSVGEVVVTLAEAIGLVVLVMFVFLQSWRATLVPAIAVPVVLLGTFAVFSVAGFSINTLTLFGLVLAIGLLVDDAIVVVENVIRLMDENPGMSPRDATIRSMGEIQMALIAIAMVLSAVFLPMAFFGGTTGVIYRQFSISIVSAMLLSVAVALILSPALTATLLKRRAEAAPRGWLERHAPSAGGALRAAHDGFNRSFVWARDRYLVAVRGVAARKLVFLPIYAAICVLLAFLFARLPTGFLPTEDQGGAILQYRLPAGATLGRTLQVQHTIEQYLEEDEGNNLDTIFMVSGAGGGQNTGRGYLNFKDWSERPGKANSAEAIAARANRALSGLRDANVFVLVPPPVRGLGQSNGFTMELQNTSGMTREAFEAARDKLLAAARKNPVLAAVRPTELPDVPALHVDIDQQKVKALGLDEREVNDTLEVAWGPRYVNDFVDRGRIKRVYVEGDAPYRNAPRDLSEWYVRSSDGRMAPFSAFATTSWLKQPATLSRFSGVPSLEIQGQAAPGTSSGDAMREMERLAAQIPGTSVAWSGLSYQERLSSGQAPLLYGLSLLVVFLCLAALYESWSIPLAVLLIVPLGLVGAVFATALRGLQNDVYLQIGLLTTMGLAAKNAILMIEFAQRAQQQGQNAIEAALEGARIRLRPILMTSLAFMFGVLPLAVSTGAGANARIGIGTAVVGGMLTATILAIFYIPLFFVLVRRGTRAVLEHLHHGGDTDAQAT